MVKHSEGKGMQNFQRRCTTLDFLQAGAQTGFVLGSSQQLLVQPLDWRRLWEALLAGAGNADQVSEQNRCCGWRHQRQDGWVALHLRHALHPSPRSGLSGCSGAATLPLLPQLLLQTGSGKQRQLSLAAFVVVKCEAESFPERHLRNLSLCTSSRWRSVTCAWSAAPPPPADSRSCLQSPA